MKTVELTNFPNGMHFVFYLFFVNYSKIPKLTTKHALLHSSGRKINDMVGKGNPQ